MPWFAIGYAPFAGGQGSTHPSPTLLDCWAVAEKYLHHARKPLLATQTRISITDCECLQHEYEGHLRPRDITARWQRQDFHPKLV